MNVKKTVYIVLGVTALGLGAIGTVLPLLPSVPFLMLAAYCFAKSSERLHTWFIGTDMYKKNLESFVKGKAMTRRTKFRIMGTVTLVMAIGFIMMGNVPIGRIVLVIVWVCHIIYFKYGIRTCTEEESLQIVASGTKME